MPPYTGTRKCFFLRSLSSSFNPYQMAGIMKHNINVKGNPQQMEAACNAFKTSFAVASSVPAPPNTNPVATKPEQDRNTVSFDLTHGSP